MQVRRSGERGVQAQGFKGEQPQQEGRLFANQVNPLELTDPSKLKSENPQKTVQVKKQQEKGGTIGAPRRFRWLFEEEKKKERTKRIHPQILIESTGLKWQEIGHEEPTLNGR